MTLKEAMKLKGLNDATLAEKVGVSRPFITRIRKGERTPSLNVAVKIEAATGYPAAAFASAGA